MSLLDRIDRHPVSLGIATITIGTLLLVTCFTGALAGFFDRADKRTVRAAFASSQQLREGAIVRIDGIEVGKVKDIAGRDGARGALVTMDVEKDAGPLYRDAAALVRWRTVLGQTMYVELERGTATSGDLGSATIPRSRTSQQIEVDELTDVVRGGAREGLRTMPGELARALRDRDAPADALGALADAAPDIERGVGALRGTRQDRDLRELIGATARTVRAIDTPQGALRGAVAGGAATLETTAARQAEIRRTVAMAPGVLDRTDRTVARLDTTLALAAPLVAELRRPAGDVARTLAALRPVVVDADRLLARARPLLAALRPAVRSLASAARGGVPLVDRLLPSIDRVGGTILPYMAEKDPGTQHSMSEMIGPTFTGLGSGAGGQEDSGGHFIRFPATSGSSPAYLPCQEYFGNPDKPEVLECKSFADALSTYLNYNPLSPTPGSAPPPQGSGR